MKNSNLKKFNKDSADENISYQLEMEDDDATVESGDYQSSDGIDNATQVLSNVEKADEVEGAFEDEANIFLAEPVESIDEEVGVLDRTGDVIKDDPLITPILKAIIDEPASSSEIEEKILEKVVLNEELKNSVDKDELGEQLIDDIILNNGENSEYIKQKYNAEHYISNEDESNKEDGKNIDENNGNPYLALIKRNRLKAREGLSSNSDVKDTVEDLSATKKEEVNTVELNTKDETNTDELNTKKLDKIDDVNSFLGEVEGFSDREAKIQDAENQIIIDNNFSNPTLEDDAWYTNFNFEDGKFTQEPVSFDEKNFMQDSVAFDENKYIQDSKISEVDKLTQEPVVFDENNFAQESKIINEDSIKQDAHKVDNNYIVSEIDEGDSTCIDNEEIDNSTSEIDGLLNDMGFYLDENGKVQYLDKNKETDTNEKHLSDEEFDRYLQELGSENVANEKLNEKTVDSFSDINSKKDEKTDSVALLDSDVSTNKNNINESEASNSSAVDSLLENKANNDILSENTKNNKVNTESNKEHNTIVIDPNDKDKLKNLITNNILAGMKADNVDKQTETAKNNDDVIDFEDFNKEILSGVLTNKKIKPANKNNEKIVRLFIDDGKITCQVCGHINKKGTKICEMCSNYLEEK